MMRHTCEPRFKFDRRTFEFKNYRDVYDMSVKDLAENYTNTVLIYFAGQEEPFQILLRGDEVERFYRNIDRNRETVGTLVFFCCETIDGRSLAINVSAVQALRVLWEPSAFPDAERRYDGPVGVFLKSRVHPLTTGSGDSEQLYGLFADCENGIEAPRTFLRIVDESGEHLLFKAEDLLVLEAPTHLVREGRQGLMEGLGIED